MTLAQICRVIYRVLSVVIVLRAPLHNEPVIYLAAAIGYWRMGDWLYALVEMLRQPQISSQRNDFV